MRDIKIKAKSVFKKIDAKRKIDKAKKAVKSAFEAAVDLTKDISSVTIGLENNKHIEEISFERQGKDYTIKVKGK